MASDLGLDCLLMSHKWTLKAYNELKTISVEAKT